MVNAGISGETTSGALSRVNWVLGLEPDIVILATGGNDGLRGIAPELTARNLDQLVTTFQDAGVTVLLAAWRWWRTWARSTPAHSAPSTPPSAPPMTCGSSPSCWRRGHRPRSNQPDFIHPNADGYAVVVATIYPT
ncbi:MAG: GDSL-type esterase/lipase family protein [Caldilineaceae bacterium]